MIYALFAMLCILNLADALLTIRILKDGGQEKNPLMARLMMAVGTAPALAASKAIVLLLAWNWLLPSPAAPWILSALCGLYAWVVWHNTTQLRP